MDHQNAFGATIDDQNRFLWSVVEFLCFDGPWSLPGGLGREGESLHGQRSV